MTVFYLKYATTTNSSLIKLQLRAESLLDFDLNFDEITREISVFSSETSIGSKRKTRMEDTRISSQNKKVTVSIPVIHDLKFKPDLSMMKEKVEKYDSLVSILHLVDIVGVK